MRIVRAPLKEIPQCTAIVQPGEYTIDRWDNERCGNAGQLDLVMCAHCGKLFCIMMHWHRHLDTLTPEELIGDGFGEAPY